MNSHNRASALLGILVIALLACAQPAAAAPWGECCEWDDCIVLAPYEMCMYGTFYPGENCTNEYVCCFADGSCAEMYPSCCLDQGGTLYLDVDGCDDPGPPAFRCPQKMLDEQLNETELTPIEDDASSTGGGSILMVGLLLATVVPLVSARRRVRT